ncbi:MAG: hypothetical protein ACLTSX_06725 [Collinsella sp.]
MTKKMEKTPRARPLAGWRARRRSLVAFGLTALFAGTLAGCGAKPAERSGPLLAKAVELQIFAANSLEGHARGPGPTPRRPA